LKRALAVARLRRHREARPRRLMAVAIAGAVPRRVAAIAAAAEREVERAALIAVSRRGRRRRDDRWRRRNRRFDRRRTVGGGTARGSLDQLWLRDRRCGVIACRLFPVAAYNVRNRRREKAASDNSA